MWPRGGTHTILPALRRLVWPQGGKVAYLATQPKPTQRPQVSFSTRAMGPTLNRGSPHRLPVRLTGRVRLHMGVTGGPEERRKVRLCPAQGQVGPPFRFNLNLWGLWLFTLG